MGLSSVKKGKEGQASLATEIEGKETVNGDVGEQKKFAKMLDKEEKRLREMWCRGRRGLYLAALFTDPEWQGQSIGSTVIGRVCERADQDGVLGICRG